MLFKIEITNVGEMEKMINYTETPHLQSASKNIMAALQSKYGIDQILELDDKLVLIGKDWCYKSDNGLQLVERELAAKSCMRLGEKNSCGNAIKQCK